MKHYDSFENFKYDKSLLGEEIWAWNKYDGQNFCAKYSPKVKSFTMFGSKTQNVDETSEQFGNAVKYFKLNIDEKLRELIKEFSSKREVFHGIDEITCFFEWHGQNSFAGFHDPYDELKLTMIDIFLKKKGYIEPKAFYQFNDKIEIAELIYKGKLNMDFINSIYNNYWADLNCLYPTVKEGVVCKRSTLMKGQRLPKVKIKTNWWYNKLMEKYPDRYKELE